MGWVDACEVLYVNLKGVGSLNDFLDADVLVEDVYVLQWLEEQGNVADVIQAHELPRDLLGNGNGESYESNSSDLDHDVENMLDHLVREAVYEACDEPFEDPHRLVYGQVLVKVFVELCVFAFEDVPEDCLINLWKGEAILEEPEEEEAPVDCDVDEYPESV